MTTLLFTHDDSLRHITPPGHPERVARLEHLLPELDGKALTRLDAPLGSSADVELCHPKSYVDKIRASEPADGIARLDADTCMSPGSFDAAMRGVGGVVKAVDMIMAGEATNGFVATRPPGHHAEQETPMGFCLFGTIAIAARHALERHSLSKVAVVDFDVHHGNGTQALLWDEPRALFISSHQMPLWPGSGAASETGGSNNIMNVPLDPGTASQAFRTKYEGLVFPALEAFEPEFIFVSAGFDAHKNDPLANIMLESEDFGWVTERICEIAKSHCDGRVVSCLEGGYDLAGMTEGGVSHVDALIAATT